MSLHVHVGVRMSKAPDGVFAHEAFASQGFISSHTSTVEVMKKSAADTLSTEIITSILATS